MVRQTRTRKSDNFVIGKGKVTPVQVAFIVDRYLADNNFPKTRSVFRSEAFSLLSKCSVNEAPRSLLSLSAMLDDYVCLKEQTVIVDQTQRQLEQEKSRVFALSQGVQNLLNDFNASASSNCAIPPLDPFSNNSIVPYMDSEHVVFSPSECAAVNAPLLTSTSAPVHGKSKDPADFSTPASNSIAPRKRKSYKAVPDTFEPTKKSCASMCNNQSKSQGTSAGQTQDHAACPQDNAKQSIVAKNLFNRPSSQSPNSNSSGPKTPQRSVSSQSEKSISPPEEISSTGKSNKHETLLDDTTPSNCTIISSKTIILNSPAKCYSLERKRCTFSSPSKGNLTIHSKRDHVKGRLDFDAPDMPMKLENASVDACTTSESDKDVDIFDIDLDALGGDFSISDLLHDFAIECGGVGPPCHQATGVSSTSPLTGSLGQPDEGDFHVSQDLIEQDQKTKGSDSITSVKSITQCIQISSPAKKAKGCGGDQDDASPGNSTDS